MQPIPTAVATAVGPDPTPAVAVVIQNLPAAASGLTGSPTTDAALIAAGVTLLGMIASHLLSRKTSLDVLGRTLTHQRQLALDDQASKERIEKLKLRLDRRSARVRGLREGVARYIQLWAQLMAATNETRRDFEHEMAILREVKVHEDVLVRATPAVTNSPSLSQPVSVFSQAGMAHSNQWAALAQEIMAGRVPMSEHRLSPEDPLWQILIRAAGDLDEAIEHYIEAD